MKRAAVCSLAIGFCLAGCSTLKKPFFYEIERAQHTSYVLGTLHIGVEASELPGFIHEDLRNSKAFVSEISQQVLDQQDEGKLRDSLMRDFRERIRSKTRLSARLRPASWLKFQDLVLAKEPAFDRKLIDFLPPRSALGIVQAAQQGEIEPVEVSRAEYFQLRFSRLDLELYKDASKRDLALVSIDRSVQIDRCLEEFYMSGLESALSTDGKQSAEELMRLIRAYREGDEAALVAVADGDSDSKLSSTADDCILSERNRNWSELIDRFDPDKGPFFIAVGARHLLGKGSLLSLLEGLGFKVRRVTQVN